MYHPKCSCFFFFFFLVITPMGEITISENGGLWYVPEIRLSDSSFFILLSTISGWCFIEFKFGGSLFGLGPSKGISNPVVNLQPNMGYYHNVSKNIHNISTSIGELPKGLIHVPVARMGSAWLPWFGSTFLCTMSSLAFQTFMVKTTSR